MMTNFRKFKKTALLFFLILLPIALTCSTKAVAEENLDNVIHELQVKYDNIEILTARFTQEVFSSSLGGSERAEGTVSFKKPGKMRWLYSGGGEIISNGKLVWVYDPELAQVIETDVDLSRPTITTDFLSGLGNLQHDFDIKLLKADASGFDLSLTPRTPMGNTVELIVQIDRTYLLKKTIAIDSFKNETRVTFHAINISGYLPDSDFEYTAKPGIKIIRP
jgi:outer membrane lipoprotein carrier protein